MQELAEKVKDNWITLAGNLGFGKVAIQRLKKDYSKEGEDVVAFKMLMDWIKKCSRESDKVGIL